MSSDGDIEIAVKAEGADDAAADLGGGGEGGGGGGGGGGGKQSLAGKAGKAGTIGLVIASLLGPLLNLLDPILKILQAALAPVAVLLMRLLQPVLKGLIKLLPLWFNFINDLPGMVDRAVEFIRAIPGRIGSFLSSLPGMIWQAFKSGASWLAEGASNIGSEVWKAIKTKFNKLVTFVKNLPANLGRKIASVVPRVEFDGDDRSTGSAALDLARNENVRQGSKVILRGGLETFVERIERDGRDLLE